jgi:hypothetical protein
MQSITAEPNQQKKSPFCFTLQLVGFFFEKLCHVMLIKYIYIYIQPVYKYFLFYYIMLHSRKLRNIFCKEKKKYSPRHIIFFHCLEKQNRHLQML